MDDPWPLSQSVHTRVSEPKGRQLGPAHHVHCLPRPAALCSKCELIRVFAQNDFILESSPIMVVCRGFPTRMVHLYYISCLRYTILVGNARCVSLCSEPHLSAQICYLWPNPADAHFKLWGLAMAVIDYGPHCAYHTGSLAWLGMPKKENSPCVGVYAEAEWPQVYRVSWQFSNFWLKRLLGLSCHSHLKRSVRLADSLSFSLKRVSWVSLQFITGWKGSVGLVYSSSLVGKGLLGWSTIHHWLERVCWVSTG